MADPQAQDITGTLSGMNINGLIQAMAQQQAQQQAQLASQTAQAQQQAQQAGQQYQQAAAAPPAQANPLALLLPALAGNVASVLGGQSAPAEHGHQAVQQTRSQVLQKQSDNLQALHDAFIQKADEAKKAGDLETEIKNRNAAALNAKRMELVKDQLDRQNKLDVAKISASSRENVANIKGTNAATASDESSVFPSLVITTRRGSKVLDLTDLSPKEKMLARQWAADQTKAGNPVMAASKETVAKLRDVDTARSNIDDMRGAIGFLPNTAQERLTKGPAILAQYKLQNNPEINSFRSFRVAAIQQLKALAGGVGSGLRINQAEIAQAVENDIPKITDTRDVAEAKLKRVEKLLDRAESPFAGRNWSIGQPTAPSSPSAAAPQVQKWGRDANGRPVPIQ